MSCPTDDEFDRFLGGRLDSAAIERLEGHIDTCARCEDVLVRRARATHGRAPLGEGTALLGRGDEVGRFLVLDLLGSGAMGTVYGAYDPKLDRRVALKVLECWSASGRVGVQLALREARALARLNHPNVVTIYEAGELDRVAYIAMELVTGLTLGRWLERPRSADEVARVFVGVVAGLAAAHRLGLVHRDLKPSNILVGDDGRVRVSDFGLAAPPGAGSAGTFAYAAPEVRRGAPADQKSDQYSACLVFAQALTGVREPHVPWSVPAPLRAALRRGLSADPARRFRSMDELAEALAASPARPWLAASALLACGVVGFAAAGRDPCAPSTDMSEAIWSEARNAELKAAGAEPLVIESVSRKLSTVRGEWEVASVELCRARGQGAMSEDALEASRQCLAERHADAVRVSSVVARLSAARSSSALPLVESLAPPVDCLLRDVSLRPSPPVDDQKLLAAITAVETGLEAARLQRDLGNLREARQQLEPLLARARQVGFASLTSRVAFRLGSLDARLGDHDAGIARLEEAVVEGLASREDEAATQAAILLVYEHGVVQSAHARAQQYRQVAEALVRRHPSLERLGPGLRLNAGLVLEASGALDTAAEEIRLSAMQFAARDPDGYATGNALLNQARVEVMTGNLAAAEACARRALDIIRSTRGQAHPHVAVGLTVLGVIDRERGAFAGALANFEEAARISSMALGARHQQTLSARDELNRTLLVMGRSEAALDGATRLSTETTSPEALTTLAECLWQLEERERSHETMMTAASKLEPRPLGDAPARLALLEAQHLRGQRAAGARLATERALRLAWRGSRVERTAAQLVAAQFTRERSAP